MALTKQMADEIMKKYQGEARGVAFLTDAEYVRKRWGAEGLAKVKEALCVLGYPIEYEKIKALAWLPLGQRVLSMSVIVDTFNMSRAEVEEMGYTAPKLSFLMKWVVKYFASVKETIEQAPLVWKKHYTSGELETMNQEGDNYALVKIKGLVLSDKWINYLQGFLRRVTEYSTGKPVFCELISSTESEGALYEFKLWWDK
ncbi:MAG: hypothetical protein KKC80_06220 [Candidatus Margulisbacteria bacterium]|nr:hypothetical protein [Candidatus Margulisiibacteriota bacterium]MBU1616674.1 hypothetical protein [Candidatus Margulisiibacteriota bacterium]